MRPIANFLKLSAADRRMVGSAFLVVLLTRLGLWIIGYRNLRIVLARLRSSRGRPRASDGSVDRVAWAVRVVSRYIPKASCLTQALSMELLLSRIGLESTLHLGVRRDRADLEAHAWVECGGRIVIGGTDAADRYQPLSMSKPEVS